MQNDCNQRNGCNEFRLEVEIGVRPAHFKDYLKKEGNALALHLYAIMQE